MMPTDMRDIGHLLNQTQLRIIIRQCVCAAREGFYIAAGPAVSIRVMMDLDTLCTTWKKFGRCSCGAPHRFPSAFIGRQGRTKREKKKKDTVGGCVALAVCDAAIHRRQQPAVVSGSRSKKKGV